MNAAVFAYSGAATLNFFIRWLSGARECMLQTRCAARMHTCKQTHTRTRTHTPPRSGLQLGNNDFRPELWQTLWMLPIIYVILLSKRLVLTLAFRPLFKAIRGDLVRVALMRRLHLAPTSSNQGDSCSYTRG